MPKLANMAVNVTERTSFFIHASKDSNAPEANAGRAMTPVH
jgi:hypothetical protein